MLADAEMGLYDMFPVLASTQQRLAARDNMRFVVAAVGNGTTLFYASPDVRSSIEPCAVRSLLRSLEDAPLPPSKRAAYVSPDACTLEAECPVGAADSYLVLGRGAVDALRAPAGAVSAASLRAAPAPAPRPDTAEQWYKVATQCMFPMMKPEFCD